MQRDHELRRFRLRGPRWRTEELPGEAGLALVTRGPVLIGGRPRRTGSAVAFEGGLQVSLRAVRSELLVFVGQHAARAELSAEEIRLDPVLGSIAPVLTSESTGPDVAVALAHAFLLRLSERQGDASGVHDPVVRAAIETVLADLARHWTVPQLASAVGRSRAAFARRFSRAMGESPHRHLTRLRLRRAAQRLVSTEDGLAAIAHEVGYASEFAFGRAFKRHYGVAPGVYRARWNGPASMAA